MSFVKILKSTVISAMKIGHIEYLKRLSDAKWSYLKSLQAADTGELTSESYKYINPAHITTKLSPLIGRHEIGASFRILLSNYILEKKFYTKDVARGSNDKVRDARFIESQGFPVPRMLAKGASVDEVLAFDQCLIKPVRGAAAKGVFIKDGARFLHVYDKKEFDEAGFRERVRELGVARFLIEDVVGGVDGFTTLKDLKLYCFYGEVALALEIKRGEDPIRHCFYRGDGEVVLTGKYKESLFQGDGVNANILDMGRQISSLIPSPFIRVDFIVGGNDFAVGELTAHPGGYEDFNHEWDHKLGVDFLKARARLFEDLLAGKSFSAYLNT